MNTQIPGWIGGATQGLGDQSYENEGIFPSNPSTFSFPISQDASPFDGGGSALGQGSCDGGDAEGGALSELSSLLAQVASLLPGLLQGSMLGHGNAGDLGGGQPSPNQSESPYQAQTPYSNFQASSQGDPHLSFNGTTPDGTSNSSHWDNMQSHQDLLSSNSFEGGFRVSNLTTAVQSDGKTMNGVVDVHTNYGKNDIRYDANGNASLNQNGSWQNIAPGTNLTLDDGTRISDNVSNQLTVTKNDDSGAEISTTLSANGQGGVDLSASGKNVKAGGYLARDGFSS